MINQQPQQNLILEDPLSAWKAEYERGLAYWGQGAENYARLVADLLDTMRQLADVGTEVEAERLNLVRCWHELRGRGVHVPRPSYPDGNVRTVLDATSRGPKAAVAAMASVAKAHVETASKSPQAG